MEQLTNGCTKSIIKNLSLTTKKQMYLALQKEIFGNVYIYSFFDRKITTMGQIYVNTTLEDEIQLAIFEDCGDLQCFFLEVKNREYDYEGKDEDEQIIKMFDNMKLLTKDDINYLITKYKQDILPLIKEIKDLDVILYSSDRGDFETLSYKKIN